MTSRERNRTWSELWRREEVDFNIFQLGMWCVQNLITPANNWDAKCDCFCFTCKMHVRKVKFTCEKGMSWQKMGLYLQNRSASSPHSPCGKFMAIQQQASMIRMVYACWLHQPDSSKFGPYRNGLISFPTLILIALWQFHRAMENDQLFWCFTMFHLKWWFSTTVSIFPRSW